MSFTTKDEDVSKSSLEKCRSRIDEIDAEIVNLLAQRQRVITEVSEHKKSLRMSVVQPERINAVIESRVGMGEQLGISPSFVRRLWSIVIGEACRIEELEMNPDADRSKLQDHAIRIDHAAIAVKDLGQAIDFYCSVIGFRLSERRKIDGEFSGMDTAVIEAGSVALVLVQATDPNSNVAQYIEQFGPGVQHIAIEVDDIAAVRNDCERRGLPLLPGIFQASGLKQSFSRRDFNSGMQIEIVERHGRGGFEEDNVNRLFRVMEQEGVF